MTRKGAPCQGAIGVDRSARPNSSQTGIGAATGTASSALACVFGSRRETKAEAISNTAIARALDWRSGSMEPRSAPSAAGQSYSENAREKTLKRALGALWTGPVKEPLPRPSLSSPGTRVRLRRPGHMLDDPGDPVTRAVRDHEDLCLLD